MEYSKVEEKFGKSWARLWKPFIESDKFDNIFRQLKAESAKGKVICPKSSDLFRCYRETPVEDVRAIFVGFCPYDTLDEKKEPIADGLCFSCSKTGRPQSSLEVYWEGYEDCFGFTPKQYPTDLQYLANNGVLLFNCQLSTEAQKAGSHEAVWKEFTTYFFEEIVANAFSGIPIVFFGSVASKYEKMVNPLQHWTITVEHPAAVAYRKNSTGWQHKSFWKTVSKIIWDSNKHVIDWEKSTKSDMPF
jgi:uracil-DNA glycosylase